MTYHLYKRTVNGKKSWYYWYYQDGKQIRKSCKAETKKDAEKFIADLESQDAAKKEYVSTIPFEVIATEMFKENSDYLKLMAAYGHEFSPPTLRSKRSALNKYVIPEFGKRLPDQIDSAEIEGWIIGLDVSNSYRNFILHLMEEIFTECKRLKMLKEIPELRRFVNHSQRKDVFTDAELQKLFPADLQEWNSLYGSKADYYIGIDGKFHEYGFMFGLIFYTMLCTGIRPGEVRALTLDQIIGNAIYLNKSISDGKVVEHLKKGNEDNPRFRVSIMPSKLNSLMEYWFTIRPETDSKQLFPFHDNFVNCQTLHMRLDKALIKTEIFSSKRRVYKSTSMVVPVKTRRLSPHSFRFTYNSKIVQSHLIPGDTLRQMMGHLSKQMTDYYTRPDVTSQINGLKGYQKLLDEIF